MLKGENTREMIIEKSAELFNIYGYHGCSLSDIMKATHLKKGGIYNHFKNKDEIAFAAFDYAFNTVIRRFRVRLDKDKTSTEKLHSILTIFQNFLYEPILKGGCPIANIAMDATGSHPELIQRAIRAFNTLQTYIAIKIDEGIENGEFNEDASSKEMSLLIISTLEGALMMSRVTGNEIYMKTATNFLSSYINDKLIRK